MEYLNQNRMTPKKKAKELMDYAIKLDGSEDAKQQCLITAEQLTVLAPFEERNYWNKVKEELVMFKVEE